MPPPVNHMVEIRASQSTAASSPRYAFMAAVILTALWLATLFGRQRIRPE
jgi:hypothetical protein